jgi:hypothetical protein
MNRLSRKAIFIYVTGSQYMLISMPGKLRGNSARPLLVLLIFGIAFGYLEAAVVCYLRVLHEPARLKFHPQRNPADLFPLLTLEQVRTAGPDQTRVLWTEIGREASTMVMLAAVAAGVTAGAGEWVAAFAAVFGVWDIAFYLFLKLLIDWPASLLTWDVLFLLPVPWVGPVLAPVLVSLGMIAGGVWYLVRNASASPFGITRLQAQGILLGAIVIIGSMAMDYRNILAGGMPRPFHWGVFVCGYGLACGSYIAAAVPAAPKRRAAYLPGNGSQPRVM